MKDNTKTYKVIVVDYDIKYEKAEKLMNDMSENGWEVVCMSPQPVNTLKVVITFARTAQ